MKEFLEPIIEKSSPMTSDCLRAEMFNILAARNLFTAKWLGSSVIIGLVVSEKVNSHHSSVFKAFPVLCVSVQHMHHSGINLFSSQRLFYSLLCLFCAYITQGWVWVMILPELFSKWRSKLKVWEFLDEMTSKVLSNLEIDPQTLYYPEYPIRKATC